MQCRTGMEFPFKNNSCRWEWKNLCLVYWSNCRGVAANSSWWILRTTRGKTQLPNMKTGIWIINSTINIFIYITYLLLSLRSKIVSLATNFKKMVKVNYFEKKSFFECHGQAIKVFLYVVSNFFFLILWHFKRITINMLLQWLYAIYSTKYQLPISQWSSNDWSLIGTMCLMLDSATKCSILLLFFILWIWHIRKSR